MFWPRSASLKPPVSLSLQQESKGPPVTASSLAQAKAPGWLSVGHPSYKESWKENSGISDTMLVTSLAPVSLTRSGTPRHREVFRCFLWCLVLHRTEGGPDRCSWSRCQSTTSCVWMGSLAHRQQRRPVCAMAQRRREVCTGERGAEL